MSNHIAEMEIVYLGLWLQKVQGPGFEQLKRLDDLETERRY